MIYVRSASALLINKLRVRFHKLFHNYQDGKSWMVDDKVVSMVSPNENQQKSAAQLLWNVVPIALLFAY